MTTEQQQRERALIQVDLRLVQLAAERKRVIIAYAHAQAWRRVVLQTRTMPLPVHDAMRFVDDVILHLPDHQRVDAPLGEAQRNELVYWTARRAGQLDAHDGLWMLVCRGALMGPFASLAKACAASNAEDDYTACFIVQVGHEHDEPHLL